MILITAITALVLSAQILASGRCPSADDIKPCTCSGQLVSCYATHGLELELDKVFLAIAEEKTESDLLFDTFELSSNAITQLDDSIFHGVKFKTLKFMSCSQLACVNPMAFAGMEKTVEKFVSKETSFRWDVNHVENCNIFNALSRLTNLHEVNITGSNINEIPKKAFHSLVGQQTKLVTIDLSGGAIVKVGENAFTSLSGLKYLDLSSNKINQIDSSGFEFFKPSTDKLLINLKYNNITYKSFANDSFKVNGRSTSINLGGNPFLQVLEYSVFESFLNSKEQNHIDLKGSPLICNKKNSWILEHQSVLKLKQKISNAISPDGHDFWDHPQSKCDHDLDPIKFF